MRHGARRFADHRRARAWPALRKPKPKPPSQTPASDRPVFRAGVDVVRLDIRVIDDSGKPVSDLRPDEVEVIDSGTKEPVVLFQHIAPAGRSNSEARQRTIAAEISTNQGAPRGHLYVLVFDQDHLTSGAEQRVRQSAEKFLRQQVHARGPRGGVRPARPRPVAALHA